MEDSVSAGVGVHSHGCARHQEMWVRERPIPLVLRDPATLSAEDRARRRARLRNVHLETGVDPRYLTMPEGTILWFVSVSLDVAIHAHAVGFTRLLYEFALGVDEAQAIEAVRAWLRAIAPEVNVVGGQARLSSSCHPEELWCPEEVRRLDLPAVPARRRLLEARP